MEHVLAELLADAGQAEHVAGQVLVVVAVDVVRVHRRGRGVVERHAGDGPHLPALRLQLVEEGRHELALVGDVHAVVVRLVPADELGGAGRRVGVGVEHAADARHALGVGLVGRLALEVAGGLRPQGPERPRVRAGDPGVIAAAEAVGGDHHRLRIDVERVLVEGRAGDEIAELRRGVLEGQARTLPLGVDPPRLDDRRGLRRRPVHAVEPDDEQVLGPPGHGVALDPVEVALVGVLGVGVDGVLGQEAIEGLDLRRVAVEAVRPHDGPQVDLGPEGVDRDQPVGVAAVVGEDAPRPLRAEMVRAVDLAIARGRRWRPAIP